MPFSRFENLLSGLSYNNILVTTNFFDLFQRTFGSADLSRRSENYFEEKNILSLFQPFFKVYKNICCIKLNFYKVPLYYCQFYMFKIP